MSEYSVHNDDNSHLERDRDPAADAVQSSSPLHCVAVVPTAVLVPYDLPGTTDRVMSESMLAVCSIDIQVVTGELATCPCFQSRGMYLLPVSWYVLASTPEAAGSAVAAVTVVAIVSSTVLTFHVLAARRFSVARHVPASRRFSVARLLQRRQ